MQWGQYSNEYFYNFRLSEGIPSSWRNWPTPENQSAKYKYVSVEWNMDLDEFQWQRSTYSILDWLGDLGGLYDALAGVCRFLLGPTTAYALQSTLMTGIFRVREREDISPSSVALRDRAMAT